MVVYKGPFLNVNLDHLYWDIIYSISNGLRLHLTSESVASLTQKKVCFLFVVHCTHITRT